MNMSVPPSGRFPRFQGRTQPFPAAPPPLPPRSRRPVRGPARNRRTIRRNRRTGRQPHPGAPPAHEPVAGHDPQRDGRPDRRRAAVRARIPRPAGCPPTRACGCSSTGCCNFGELAEEEREIDQPPRWPPPAAAWRTRWPRQSTLLSGLSAAAGLVLAPKSDGALRHIEFVPLGPGRALVVLVNADGHVENRVIETPPGLPPLGPAAGLQLPQRPPVGPAAGRPAPRRGRGNGRQPHANWTRCRRWWSRPASRPGPAKAAPAA